jgi:dimethylaniline monooxygenase (N-oxide forming)
MNAPTSRVGAATEGSGSSRPALPKVCIVGAGSSGIACCKAFKQSGIPFDCFEASDRVGGMWVFKNSNGMSSTYRSLHINTSRRRMEFLDFPMPDDYPDFPSHFQIAEYFDAYADHFGIRESITFRTKVECCERLDGGGWDVTLSSGETRRYDALVVANGHHWDPSWPEPDFPGAFSGVRLHSHHYVDPTDPVDLRDKTVVIIGFGNSAMDIACELGQKTVARKVFLSTRSGGYIFPKYLGATPADEKLMRHPSEKPSWFERLMHACVPDQLIEWTLLPFYHWLIRSRVGEPWHYGLPRPQHPFGRTHPTISSEIHIRLGSGDVIPKPNVARFDGARVEFVDGTSVEADAVIYATGYKISFPFLDPSIVDARDNDIALYHRIFDPRHPDLLFLALVQPLCAMMPIAEEQSKVMAAYLTGRYHLPPAHAMERVMHEEHERMKARFTASKRHTIEIDCQAYTYKLWRELRAGERRARRAGGRLQVEPLA